MTQPRRYRTRQRELVASYLTKNSDSYHSVDDVWSGICFGGSGIGRSTVYRCLESMVEDGSALKATSPGGEARYRLAMDDAVGQLVCLECGRALPLDCHMVADFSTHVLEHHAFSIDPARTVLYGHCDACMGARR